MSMRVYPKVSRLKHLEKQHKGLFMAAKLTTLTHKIAIQLHLVARKPYHLQFSLQATSTKTFGYTLVCSRFEGFVAVKIRSVVF
jgi:hypothetical protein